MPLRRTLSEGTIAPDARAGIAQRLLAGKIGEPAPHVVQFAVRQVWSAARDLQEALRRVSRTAMFLRAERSGELDDVEDQLFRFARIVDAHPDLSVILDDPTTDPTARAGAHRPAARAARAPVGDATWSTRWPGTPAAGRSRTGWRSWSSRPRERRDKLVAIVHTAAPAHRRAGLAARRARCAASTTGTSRCTSRSIPSVLGGMRVQVGDEVIDGSVAAKLEELRRRMAG